MEKGKNSGKNSVSIEKNNVKNNVGGQNDRKAVIYARVSSKEQEETGYSLPAQEKLITEYGDRKNYEIDLVFSIAESASGSKQRKVFGEMLDYIKKEDIKILLCEKVDRITRNFKEAVVINDWLEEDPDRQIHFVKQNLIVSKNAKSDERFRWDIEIVLAKKYIANLSEEVKKGQKEKIAQGWLPTKPPLGYKTNGDKGHKIHVVDEDVAPYIRKMFELYATGDYSTVALGKKMYQFGFRSRAGGRVVKSKIHKLLSDPFYYGKFVWKDQEYVGKHEAIISRDLFDQVKAKMTRPSAPYHRKHQLELKGKMFCGSCNKTITWELQKGHRYGACKQCKAQLGVGKKYVRQEDVEEMLLEKVLSVAPRGERVLGVLKKALQESHSDEISYHDTQVKAINGSLERIQQRKRAMYDDKLDGRITADFYDEKLALFKQEEEDLANSLGKLKLDNTEYYRVGISIHELALSAREIYRSRKASVEERRLLLAYAFSRVSILGGVITPEYTKGFSFLAEWMPKMETILEHQTETAKSFEFEGISSNVAFDFDVEPDVPSKNSRTEENPVFNARKRQQVPLSHKLLHRQDSNL
jgi:site-specific DNA recombinase